LNEPPAPAQSLSVSSELPPVPPSFDLWTYLEAVANVQISQRTTPMYQEVRYHTIILYYLYLVFYILYNIFSSMTI